MVGIWVHLNMICSAEVAKHDKYSLETEQFEIHMNLIFSWLLSYVSNTHQHNIWIKRTPIFLMVDAAKSIITMGNKMAKGQIQVTSSRTYCSPSSFARSCTWGKGRPSGIGLFKKRQSGPHPCLTLNSKRRSFGTFSLIFWLYSSYTLRSVSRSRYFSGCPPVGSIKYSLSKEGMSAAVCFIQQKGLNWRISINLDAASQLFTYFSGLSRTVKIIFISGFSTAHSQSVLKETLNPLFPARTWNSSHVILSSSRLS